MQHGNRTFLLAIALSAACASAAHAQTAMSYRFKEGDKLHYLLEQKTNSTMSLAGTDIVMKVNATLSMAWHVVEVQSNGSAYVKVKVTHSKMTMESLLGNVVVDSKDKDLPNDVAGKMLGQMNKAIASMEITGTMLPTGEMKDVKISDETAKAMKAVPGASDLGDLAHPDNFRDMISGIVFPTGTVSKGKSWTHKTEITAPAGKIMADNVYTFDETIQQGGVALEKISLKPEIKIQGNPKATMKVKSIKATGYTLFDNKAGRVVESSLNQTKTGSVSVMGLVLDSITEETTTIRLLKPSEVKVDLVKTIASVKLDEEKVVEKTVATELLETLPGVSRSFTLERSYVRSVTIMGSASADAAIAAEIKALVEPAIEDIGKKVTVKESIALDGKEITKVNVLWVERSQQGTATRADGSTVTFHVKVGLRLKLEKAK
jgi:hypothetical protein